MREKFNIGHTQVDHIIAMDAVKQLATDFTVQYAGSGHIYGASTAQKLSTIHVTPDILSRKSQPRQLAIQMVNAIFAESHLVMRCITAPYVTSA